MWLEGRPGLMEQVQLSEYGLADLLDGGALKANSSEKNRSSGCRSLKAFSLKPIEFMPATEQENALNTICPGLNVGKPLNIFN